MPPLRIALAQVDVAVGDLDGNADIVSTWVARARDAGRRPRRLPGDGPHRLPARGPRPAPLVRRRGEAEAPRARRPGSRTRARETSRSSSATSTAPTSRRPGSGARPASRRTPPPCSSAARWSPSTPSTTCPNYGVFDEYRYFVPGDRFPVLRLHGIDVGLTVCEDLWQDGGPIHVAREAGVGLVVCINGSPYERGKAHTRDELSARRAKEAGAPLAYVNMVGGQDELVFDGGSLVVDADGDLLARADQFDECLLVVDLDLAAGATRNRRASVSADDGTTMAVQRRQSSLADARAGPRAARPAGRRAAGGLRRAVRRLRPRHPRLRPEERLPLGGDRSVRRHRLRARGDHRRRRARRRRVHTVALPSAYSSEHSVTDADELARRQGTQHTNVPIASDGRRLPEPAPPLRPGRGEPAGPGPRDRR